MEGEPVGNVTSGQGLLSTAYLCSPISERSPGSEIRVAPSPRMAGGGGHLYEGNSCPASRQRGESREILPRLLLLDCLQLRSILMPKWLGHDCSRGHTEAPLLGDL